MLKEIGMGLSSVIILIGLFIGSSAKETTIRGVIEGNNGNYKVDGELRNVGDGEYYFSSDGGSIRVLGECPAFTNCKGNGTLTISKQADNISLLDFNRTSKKIKVIDQDRNFYYLEDGSKIERTPINQGNLRMEGNFLTGQELYFYN